MTIEKLKSEKYIYPSMAELLIKMNEVIDAFNSFEKITVLEGYMKMCENGCQLPALCCEKCSKEEKECFCECPTRTKTENEGCGCYCETQKQPEILQCPWCDYESFDPTIESYEDGFYSVHCQCCLADGPYSQTEKEAVDAWNKRA